MSKTYTTIQGDMWDQIAYRELGSESYMTELMALNYEYRMITVFPSGIVLTLPEITQTEQTKELNLPPWKAKSRSV